VRFGDLDTSAHLRIRVLSQTTRRRAANPGLGARLDDLDRRVVTLGLHNLT
jgi:hypothetical protein